MATIDCICPPKADGQTRHPDGDTVTLRERLDFRSALTVVDAIKLARGDEDMTAADIYAAMTETYLLLGIESWTVTDAKGKPLPTTRANIRSVLLENISAAMVVAEEADETYAEMIVPLAMRGSQSSPDTPTEDSTSAPTPTLSSTRQKAGRSPSRPKPSKRSSITTSRTDGIVTITPSQDGDSSSSLSSA